MTSAAGAATAVAAPGTRGASGSTARRRRHGDTKVAYLMLTPLVVLLAIFVIWPLLHAVYISFFTWSFYAPSEFVGLDNYVNVLTDQAFLSSVLRGLGFAAMVVPAQLLIAFAFANLVKSFSGRMAGVLKVTIYVPAVISEVIASIIFTIIYAYRGGILNWALGLVGRDDTAWLGETGTALPAIAVPAIWIGMGIASLIMLAGLLDIPEAYYEVASLDGAGWWSKMVHITLPLMKNIFLYLLVTGFAGSLQFLVVPLVMTNGGPLESTTLPNLFIFRHFTNDLYSGYPIAAALLLFLVLGSVSAIIFRLVRSEKAVDG
ncbi:multiple sugar transport system permease protein [Hamadaea flava]|uniref:Carbohydrate ABC transporter permease n=1 Tax=Hamadaea flava TaxID=1742688 RepID=A0ABV8LVJ3_9ACTN|nr:sugar ABC transporter permease [Hamadaea flava]MCP2329117.1 multiple sugar transport system permease protein [Hamadaea flava]